MPSWTSPGSLAEPIAPGKERRRRNRHSASGWTGRYRLEGASAWRDCTLVDLSETGAGFQAFMLATDAVSMSTAELELVDGSRGGADPIRLRGQVCHLTRSSEGHVRVGIEFVELTELEARLIGMLFDRDAARGARRPLAPASRGAAQHRVGQTVAMAVTIYGVCAVTFMMVMYALEGRGPQFVLLFALGCLLSSAYGFMSGAWPFGVVELIWSVIAVRRYRELAPGEPTGAA